MKYERIVLHSPDGKLIIFKKEFVDIIEEMGGTGDFTITKITSNGKEYIVKE